MKGWFLFRACLTGRYNIHQPWFGQRTDKSKLLGVIALFSIFVTINVKADRLEEFTQASFGDAQGSVRDEPGCFRFDIHQDATIPTRFYLYEVYRDEQAFQAHLEAPHFKTWIATVKEMFETDTERIEMKTVFPSEEGWEQQKPDLLKW